MPHASEEEFILFWTLHTSSPSRDMKGLCPVPSTWHVGSSSQSLMMLTLYCLKMCLWINYSEVHITGVWFRRDHTNPDSGQLYSFGTQLILAYRKPASLTLPWVWDAHTAQRLAPSSDIVIVAKAPGSIGGVKAYDISILKCFLFDCCLLCNIVIYPSEWYQKGNMQWIMGG